MTKNKVKDIKNFKPGNLTAIGQSLLEVVVAVGISALILVAVASLAAGSVRTSSYNRNNAIATKYAQEALEWLRTQRDEDWSDFINNIVSGGCSGSFSWGGDCTIDPVFNRSASFLCSASSVEMPCNASADTVDVTVSVTWTDAQGIHEVRSATKFTNWRR